MPIKYLHLFERDNEFDKAYNGDSYEEPWVSLTVNHAVQSGDCSSIIVTWSDEDDNLHEEELEYNGMTMLNTTPPHSGPYEGMDEYAEFNTFSTPPKTATITSNIFIETPELIGSAVSSVTINIPEQRNLHMWYMNEVHNFDESEEPFWAGAFMSGETLMSVTGTTETPNVAMGDQMQYGIEFVDNPNFVYFSERNPEIGSIPYRYSFGLSIGDIIGDVVVTDVIYPMVDVDTINRVNYNKPKCRIHFVKAEDNYVDFDLPADVILDSPEDLLTYDFVDIPSPAVHLTYYTFGWYKKLTDDFMNKITYTEEEYNQLWNEGYRDIQMQSYLNPSYTTTLTGLFGPDSYQATNFGQPFLDDIVDWLTENLVINVQIQTTQKHA